MTGPGGRASAWLLFAVLAWAPTTTAAAETFQVGTAEIQSGTARHQFQVELAVTDAQQRQGLMHRLTLGENEGMLFLLTPIGPDVYVNGVLEVLAGTVERLGLRPGDRVHHPHFDNEPGPDR